MKPLLHYCPEDGYFADAIPLYANGVYHIYFTMLPKEGPTCWGHISTTDFITVVEHPKALIADKDETQILTGSVIHHDNAYYAFYSAYTTEGKCRIRRAISKDGIYFEKDYNNLVTSDGFYYADDITWRDPCVFFDPDCGLWKMVWCARRAKYGADAFCGVVGCAESNDLISWRLCPPLWSGGEAGTVECPDIFHTNHGWAMLYYWHETRIRRTEKLDGQWNRAKQLSPEGLDFMAGKQMFDGKRRIFAGWIPRRQCDCSPRIWAGNMNWLREIIISEDKVSTRFLDELSHIFSVSVPVYFKAVRGKLVRNQKGFVLENGFARATCPGNFRLRMCIALQGDYACFTLFFRLNTINPEGARQYEKGWMLIFDKGACDVRLREMYEWDQRPDLARTQWDYSKNELFCLDIIVHEDILEVNIDEECGLNARISGVQHGDLALNIMDGTIEVSDIKLDTLPVE
jgi:hypothetical protein